MKKNLFGILALLLISGVTTAQDYSKTRTFSFNDRVKFDVESCIRDESTNSVTIVYYLTNNTGKPIPMRLVGFPQAGDRYCDTRIVDDRGNEYEPFSLTIGKVSWNGYLENVELPSGIQVRGDIVITGVSPSARAFQVVSIGFKVNTGFSNTCMAYGIRNIPLYTLADFEEFERREKIEEAQKLLAKAEKGDAAAQYEVGVRYRDGDGMMENPAAALEWFRKSATQGNTQAMKAVGDCYYSGIGVTADNTEALRWYEQAAERGNADAQAWAGYLLFETDKEKAIKYIENSVLNGSAFGKSLMGRIFYVGALGEPDYARALPLLQDAANEGNREAQLYLGLMYDWGRGVQENKEKAVAWFQKSAEQGDHYAEGVLGERYLQGTGVMQDVDKGVEWLEKAVAGGDASALNSLGEVYYYDKYGRKNLTKAVSYWKQSADKGDLTGLANMGYVYQNGISVLKNPQTAIEYYEKAAGQGEVSSQAALGAIYKEANDLPKAFSWFEKAAAGGNAGAQYEIGLMYYYGKGAPKNTKKAAEYIEKANAAGHSAAAKVWNDLELWKYK
jgi:TPR repeat protein